MTPQARFRAYVQAFNSGEWGTLLEFYAPDVRLVIGTGTELIGRDAVIGFYRKTTQLTRRRIKVLQCLAAEKSLAAEIESEFLAVRDAPDFTARPMTKGDRYYVNGFVFYDFIGDRYTRIRAATFRREFRPAVAR